MHNTTTTIVNSRNNTESLFRLDSTDSEKEDDLNRNILSYRDPLNGFSRDTCQMSPLLFESDTDDTLQSTPPECYQRPVIAPKLPKPSNQQIFEILSTLSDIRNKISSQLENSSQHNQCCSETLLNSPEDRRFNRTIKANTENGISPSPRVTRSKIFNSRVLTRSAKRLHNVSLLNTNLETPKTKKDTRRKTKNATKNSIDKQTPPSKSNVEGIFIEPIRKSKTMVPSLRLQQPPLFENSKKIDVEFIQPNIVPNIELVDKADIELDFSNRRPSSDVQILSPVATIISLSSESSPKSTKLVTIACETKTRCVSPDLFENCDSNSVFGSQDSFDIPNGQILLSDRFRQELHNDTPPNDQHNASNRSLDFVDTFTSHSTTAVAPSRDKLMDQTNNKFAENAFEITVNDMFPNIIQIHSDSDGSKLSQIQQGGAWNELIDLTKSSSSQEITPKKPNSFLSESKNSRSKLTVSPLNRTSRWLSKRSANELNKIPYRCRRLDLWFQDDIELTSTKTTMERKSGKKTIAKMLLSSDEDEDS